MAVRLGKSVAIRESRYFGRNLSRKDSSTFDRSRQW